MASRRCEQCRNNSQKCTKIFDGLETRYCVSCTKTHDPGWHAAYVAATRCDRCKKRKRSTQHFKGRETRCCISCSEIHDKEWHAALVASHRCKDHSINGCDTSGCIKYDGYCSRCFAHRFPNDKRTRFTHCKELVVGRFVREQFPDLSWVFDQRIAGGCSRRRPDIFLHLGSHALTIEVDEHEHLGESYQCICERRKMMEHFQDAGRVLHVFIRFNPDAYTDSNGVKHKSCWGKTPKTCEPRLVPKQIKQWENRLEKLRQQVQHWLNHIPSREITTVELFYSATDSPAQGSPA